MILSILLNVLLPVFLVAGISAVAQRKLCLDIDTFAKVAFYVFSPALVIDVLFTSDVSGAEYGRLALGLIGTTGALWVFGEVAARVLRLADGTRAAFLLTMLLANTGNYGLPVTLFAFGEAGMARSVLLVTVNSMIWSSVGVYIAARGRASSSRDNLRRVLSAPALYAVVVGLVFTAVGWTLPEPLLKAASTMGKGVVPVSLVVLGAQMLKTLREKRGSSHVGALVVASIGRLILAPTIAWLVGGAIGLDVFARKVLVLETATPSAVMALVLATESDTDVPFAAMVILVTTVASLVTVTLWLRWLM